MKYTNSFDDFLFDSLLEKSNNMLYFILSERLYNLLNSIKHPIAKDIIKLSDRTDALTEITLIDYHEKNHNLFTFVMSNKLFDYQKELHGDREDSYIRWSVYTHSTNSDNEIWSLFRSDIRIGRFVNRLFPGKYPESGKVGEDIQSFIDNVKSRRSSGTEKFRIVEGEDLVKYYNEKSYSLERGPYSQLHQSCMRYDKCGEYMDFYVENNVQMVILISDKEEDKITGRAVLWKLDEPDRYFMDRVYCVYDYDVERFKDFAKENNWLYKKYQNRDPREYICDPQKDECEQMVMKIFNMKPTDKYPYLDTLSYYYENYNVLSNSDGLNLSDGDRPQVMLYLQSTDGGYSVDGMDWSPYYDRLIDPDDLIYCEFGDDHRFHDDCIYVETDDAYATREYADEHLRYSEIQNVWINPDSHDAVYLKKYDDIVTSWYIDSNMFYNEVDDDYLLPEDGIWSDYHQTYIPKDESIKIIYGVDGENRVVHVHKKFKEDFKKKFEKEFEKDGEIYFHNLTDKELKKFNI